MNHFKISDIYAQKVTDGYSLIINGILDQGQILISVDQVSKLINEPEIYMVMVPERDINHPSGRVVKLKLTALPETIQIYANGIPDSVIDSEQLKNALKKNSFRIRAAADPISENKIKIHGSVFAGDGQKVSLSLVNMDDESDGSSDSEIRIPEIQRMNDEQLQIFYAQKENLESGFSIETDLDRMKNLALVLESQEESEQIPLEDIVSDTRNSENVSKLNRSKEYLSQFGLRKTISKAVEKSSQHFGGTSYHHYAIRQLPSDDELTRQKQTEFEYEPLISLIVAAYNTPESFFNEMIKSVLNQSYSNWELCIADGSDNNNIDEWLKRIKDPRIKYKKLTENQGIAGNMNEALNMAIGDYIGFFDHDDLLRKDCLFKVVQALQTHRYDVLYTDEDKYVSETETFTEPHYKPNFSIDLLRSENYITHFLVVSRSIASQLEGFRSEYEGSQDYDYVLRASEIAGSIAHIPEILYHWRIHEDSTAMKAASKMYCFENGKKALEDHLLRMNIMARVEMLPAPYYGKFRVYYPQDPNLKISILVDRPFDRSSERFYADELAESLLQSEYQNFEVLIAPGSLIEKDGAYIQLQKAGKIIEISHLDEENKAEFFNKASQHAHGDLLLFMSGELSIRDSETLGEMSSLVRMDRTGAVTGKILNRKGLISEFGTVIRPEQSALQVPAFRNLEYFHAGYQGRCLTLSNFSAFSDSALMVRKDVFMNLGGFSESYSDNEFAAEFCIRLLNKGYWNIADPFALFTGPTNRNWIKNTRSRKLSNSQNVQKSLRENLPLFFRNGDPFYNPNFENSLQPFHIPES